MSRVIVFGRIDYKNKRSINFARDEYIRHAETKAKGDMVFRPEQIFGEDLEAELDMLHIEFPRNIHEAHGKTLTNTINLFEVLLQFAIAGRIDAFVLEPGELPKQRVLMVNNDKSTVHAYAAGMEAFEEGRYADAIGPFTDAVESYGKHVWALNARGDAYFELGELEKAEADYKAARDIYPDLPNPHLGLAKIAHARGQRAATIDGCDRAMKGSIPHQPGYWICALFKAEVLLDSIEQGKTDELERESYLNNVRQIIERYESKLRQLGDARSEHYPTPESLEKLEARYEALSKEEPAGA